MFENRPRISVVMITYKQENLIKRAIDSLLSQREYIYEICVSDDCSPDNTWGVLQEYSKQYPGLFKIQRNEHNLGIFENVEKSWEMPTGDIVYRLAGDDECGENWFKKVLDFINKNNIDWKNELFGIFGNVKTVYPSGDSFISNKNSNVTHLSQNVSLLRLYLRQFITGRSCCYSIKIVQKFKKVSLGRSYMVEGAQGSQLYLYMKKAYYVNSIGNIYNAKVGVSVNMSSEESEQSTRTAEYCYKIWKQDGIEINKRDKNLPLKQVAFHNFLRKRSIGPLLKYVKYIILSFDKDICFNRAILKHNIFRIARRLPHRKPLNW